MTDTPNTHPDAAATYAHSPDAVCSFLLDTESWVFPDGDGWRYCYRAHLSVNIQSIPHARATDDTTSHDAAAQMSDKTTMLVALMRQFAQAPMTAEQAATAAGYTPADGAWKRVSDLIRLELIEPTEHTRAGKSGRQQRVHQITAAGVRWRAENRTRGAA